MTQLTGKQRRYLRSLSNRLQATVHIGKEGLSDALLKNLAGEFDHHELVKLHVNPNSSFTAKEIGQVLPKKAGALWVQTIGNSVVIYRPLDDEPKIKLPAAQ
jgi:RNA-binding protein